MWWSEFVHYQQRCPKIFLKPISRKYPAEQNILFHFLNALLCYFGNARGKNCEKTILFRFIKKSFFNVHEFFLLSSSLYWSSSNEFFLRGRFFMATGFSFVFSRSECWHREWTIIKKGKGDSYLNIWIWATFVCHYSGKFLCSFSSISSLANETQQSLTF